MGHHGTYGELSFYIIVRDGFVRVEALSYLA